MFKKPKSMFRTIRIAMLSLGLMVFYPASADQLLQGLSADTTAVVQDSIPADPLGRTTPRGTVRGFFNALGNENYLQAAQYLDLTGVEGLESDSATTALVRKLEITLNRGGTILPPKVLSGKPEGFTNDGLQPGFEEIGDIAFKSNSYPVLLERFPERNEPPIWLFSATTLGQIIQEIQANSDFYEQKLVPAGAVPSRWKGAPVQDWILQIVLAVGSYFIAWLLTLLMSWGVRLWRPNFGENKYRKALRSLMIPLRLVLAVFILLYLSRMLGVSIVVRQAFSVVNLIAMWTALFIFIWLTIDTLTSLGEEKLRERNTLGGLSAISFFRNTVKFVLIVVALLIIFDTAGVNVTAGLAALGVGGIALALGAQKTIENVIGGLSVVFDQPVSVGDFCKFGETTGTVEKIGMRSTRIRTIHRTLVTIPNSDFSSRLIENYSSRDLFLYHKTLGLRYETSTEQLKYILVELRKLLYAHSMVDPNPARVRFLEYGSDALKVEIFAYTLAKDWNDYLGIQEDLNLRIAAIIEEAGSGFAFPSQTVYMARDSGLSKERKEAAEKSVQQWREDGQLHLPEFDQQTIDALKGSINYPPGRTEN